MNPRNRLPVTVAKIIICDVEEFNGHTMGKVTECTSMVEALQAVCWLEGNVKVRGFEVVKV